MKAIIMELCGHEAVALSQDGSFVRIRNQGFVVGQEIRLTDDLRLPVQKVSKTQKYGKIIRIAAVAACICLLCIPMFSFLIMNSQSYGYVSMDVNPSVVYDINRFDKVIGVTPVNQDGEALIKDLGVHNLTDVDIEEALSLTVEALKDKGYLDADTSEVVISVSAKTERASLALQEKISTHSKESETWKGIYVDTSLVSKDLVQRAKALGTTAGKLKLIESLGDDVDVETWLDKSVAEIKAAANDKGSASVDTATKPNKPHEPSSPSETTPEVETSAETQLPIDTETEAETQPMEVTSPAETTPAETEAETEVDTEIVTEAEATEPTEETIPPEPDKEEDPESWWEWFWKWIFGMTRIR